MFQPGDHVITHDLKNQAFNGKTGQVVNCREDGRVNVRFQSVQGLLGLKPENLTKQNSGERTYKVFSFIFWFVLFILCVFLFSSFLNSLYFHIPRHKK